MEARLKNSNVDILCLQETWLAEDVEAIPISGFHIVGRLDRTSGPKRGFGGVAVYARSSLADIALFEYIEGAERMWFFLRQVLLIHGGLAVRKIHRLCPKFSLILFFQLSSF